MLRGVRRGRGDPASDVYAIGAPRDSRDRRPPPCRRLPLLTCSPTSRRRWSRRSSGHCTRTPQRAATAGSSPAPSMPRARPGPSSRSSVTTRPTCSPTGCAPWPGRTRSRRRPVAAAASSCAPGPGRRTSASSPVSSPPSSSACAESSSRVWTGADRHRRSTQLLPPRTPPPSRSRRAARSTTRARPGLVDARARLERRGPDRPAGGSPATALARAGRRPHHDSRRRRPPVCRAHLHRRRRHRAHRAPTVTLRTTVQTSRYAVHTDTAGVTSVGQSRRRPSIVLTLVRSAGGWLDRESPRKVWRATPCRPRSSWTKSNPASVRICGRIMTGEDVTGELAHDDPQPAARPAGSRAGSARATAGRPHPGGPRPGTRG